VSKRKRHVDGILNDWLTLFEERPDLRAAPSAEAVENAFASLYLTRDGTDHMMVQKAAKFFDLDEKNPAHRALLLHILADAVFWPTSKGRPKGTKRWNTERLFLLGTRARVKKRHGSPSGNSTAQQLKSDFKDDYRQDSAETIRQRLSLARPEVEKREALLRERMTVTTVGQGTGRGISKGTPGRLGFFCRIKASPFSLQHFSRD
jgi:hypothetical protein